MSGSDQDRLVAVSEALEALWEEARADPDARPDDVQRAADRVLSEAGLTAPEWGALVARQVDDADIRRHVTGLIDIRGAFTPPGGPA